MTFVDGSDSPRGVTPEWQPRCHKCAQPAEARLLYLHTETSEEEGQSAPKCKYHYQEALNLWDRIRAVAPEAVENLRILVVAP